MTGSNFVSVAHPAILHFVLIAGLMIAPVARAASPPNILFIAIDDLRPQLGCYGHDYMHTPRLDRLASQGRLFTRHYVQVPTCGASRFALLTGLRPSRTKAFGNDAFNRLSRDETEEAQTFPERFRRAGYTTVCIGKISHQPDGRVFTYEGKGDGREEVPFAWSRLATPYGKWKYGWGAFFGYADGRGRTFHPHPTPTEAADVDDDGYPDGLLAAAAVKELGALRRDGEPFLLAVGFYKPHLPFNAPKKYWDLYDPAKLPSSPNPDKPADIDPRSWHNSGEMFGRYKHPDGRRVDDAHARHLRHGYFACVSYIDAQVGKVLDALDRLGLAENTIVVVWGDHGYHLGDHNIWGKHSNFERAVHSALIMRTPGSFDMAHRGRASDAVVESLDLYPTLTDLCGLTAPPNLDGQSLRAALADPQHPGKTAALSYWRGGTTLRTDRWRLTVYPPDKNGETTIELYDHNNDPHETRNVAKEHPDVVATLRKKVDEQPVMR